MHERLAIHDTAPTYFRRLYSIYQGIEQSGLDPLLLELVYIRASQINGCAHCLDMHCKDARARGETQQRLDTLAAWRDTPFFSEPERAALGLTEALTLVAQGGVPDEVYDEAARHFDEAAMANLIWAIAEINTWNRLNVAARRVPGDYVSPYATPPAAQ